MSDMVNIEVVEQIKKQSDVLYAQLLENQSRDQSGFTADKSHGEFVESVNDLFDEFERVAPDIRLLDDYSWLLNTILQWQAFATLLKIERRIKIPEPPIQLWAPTRRTGKNDVDNWLSSLEEQLCKICQIQEVEELVQRMRGGKVNNDDKYRARIYLCREVLGGAKGSSTEEWDFIEKLPPDVYSYLEEVWFRDVIQLDAYLEWEKKGAILEGPEGRQKGDYLDALEKYRLILANQDIKRGQEKFISILEYISKSYMDEGSEILNEEKREAIIRRKAEELSKCNNKQDKETDWKEAARYVDGFYNNIISAIVKADNVASQAVGVAIKLSEGKYSRLSIMNSLEAGICLYFLKGFKYFADDWKESPAKTRTIDLKS